MRYNVLLLLSILVISCINKSIENKGIVPSKTFISQEKRINSRATKKTEIFSESETFIDSIKIAESRKYKIEITQSTIDTITNVSFNLFVKKNDKWNKIQNYSIKKESDVPLITEIKDFNNDGLNDFTIHYSTAGRGANDIRKLFVFSKKHEKFIEIKNSDLYPNLQYNNKLNCIDALSVYSGSTTTFLKLKADQLVEFARVDVIDGNVDIYLIKNNKQIRLRSETYTGSNDEMIRFVNYDPLEEYDYTDSSDN
ncbi:hypothetical protein SAMN02927916_1995 [Flavobacterium anhuiense]|uniref:Lipoprotein n=1 Tax=Flavobacterium anhuiense TaxID=459526 RepID=A0ABY0LN55_9FLAO|nr:hypothetical protein [Flavobacterium anhuiense]SCY41755.1 hypothetical protein SAMN02927916_1995 [Flavobacterium anhuiense]